MVYESLGRGDKRTLGASYLQEPGTQYITQSIQLILTSHWQLGATSSTVTLTQCSATQVVREIMRPSD